MAESKSELRRKSFQDPVGMAERIHQLDAENRKLREALHVMLENHNLQCRWQHLMDCYCEQARKLLEGGE